MSSRRSRIGGLVVVAVTALGGVATAACGGGDNIPEGAPDDVVAVAPERTRAERRAAVAVSDGRSETTAVVDLADPSGAVAETVDALLDVVDRPQRVESFGGQQVRGAPAFRYDVVVDRGGEDETLGVWVDRQGRIRRIQARTLPPATVRGGLPRLTIVDFVRFGDDAGDGRP